MSDSDKILGMTRMASKVDKRRGDDPEVYEISEEVSYHDTETGEVISDPQRIAQFEERYPNGDHDSR
jgi:hypothetical protein